MNARKINTPNKAQDCGPDAMTGYKIGQHVCFVDDNQCEVRGVVRGKRDSPDVIALKIELDDNAGWYDAKLRKG